MTHSIYDDIAYHARLHPADPAVRVRGEEIPYVRFRDDIDRVSRHIAAHELPPGRGVAVAVLDLYLHWLALHACNRLGLPTVSVNPADPPPTGFAYLADEGASGGKGPDSIALSFDVLKKPLDHWPEPATPQLLPDSVCRYIDSSGTTGTSKRVAVTYAQHAQRMIYVSASYYIARGSRVFSPIGLITMGGFMFPMTAWGVGGCVILRERDFASTVRLGHPDVVFTSPYALHEWLQAWPPGWAASGMYIFVAGGALPDDVNVRARLRLSPNLYMVYGSTESSSTSIIHAGDILRRPGCVGYTVAYAGAEIVDEAGNVLPAGTEGVIRVKCPGMATRYEGNEAASALAFRDGWFYPGDTGKFDAEGRLYVLGRVTEVINAGGAKLSPEAVEAELASFPTVADIAAFAGPAPHGTGLWIAVVPKEGFEAAALARRYAELHPDRSVPSVMPVKSIPRNEMGKVQRAVLRELAERIVQKTAVKH